MSPSGVLLVVAGAWVLCQVLGGNALGRLNIAGQTQPAPDPNHRNLAPGPLPQVPLPPGMT